MIYEDVNHRSELPIPPEGFRYLDFIGGERELRCFLVPFDMPRAQFVEECESLLDLSLQPIYKNKGICVRQDASFPIPGFYILSFLKHYRSLDEIDEVTSLRLFLILREIRKGMRTALNIPFIHLYYEEKPAKSCNVHYWLLPINVEGGEKHPIIYDLKLKEYLQKFIFSEKKEKILDYNEKMRAYLSSRQLREKDDALGERLMTDLIGLENHDEIKG